MIGKHLRNLDTKGRFIFDTDDLNQGLGYDPSTGVFTVPSGEIYVFDWTILALEGLYAHYSLKVNDQFKSLNYCNSGKSDNYRSCSKMAVVKLHERTKVGIAVFSGSADIHLRYTYFSGVNCKLV